MTLKDFLRPAAEPGCCSLSSPPQVTWISSLHCVRVWAGHSLVGGICQARRDLGWGEMLSPPVEVSVAAGGGGEGENPSCGPGASSLSPTGAAWWRNSRGEDGGVEHKEERRTGEDFPALLLVCGGEETLASSCCVSLLRPLLSKFNFLGPFGGRIPPWSPPWCQSFLHQHQQSQMFSCQAPRLTHKFECV